MVNDRTRLPKTGLFIVLEGVDGSGKTSQVKALELSLNARYTSMGYNGLSIFREPGNTYVGEGVRSIVKSGEDKDFDPITEALLFSAARRRLVLTSIIPALENNHIVICDRYVMSTMVYQLMAETNDLGYMQNSRLLQLGSCRLNPDHTIILSPPAEVCFKRVYSRNDEATDRLDGSLDLIKERQHAYRMVAEWDKASYTVLSLSGREPIEQVTGLILTVINATHANKQKEVIELFPDGAC